MKSRVLSAIIMTIIFVPLMILGGIPFTIFMALCACLSMHELLKIKDNKKKLPMIIKLFTYLIIIFLLLNNMKNIDFNYKFDYRFISVIIFLFVSPLVFIGDNDTYNISDSLYLIGITLFLGYSFNLMSIVRNYDLLYFIYLLAISIGTDTFAYISGKLVGRKKLCKTISPNKTVEGMIFGTAMGVFLGGSFYHIFINHSYSLVLLLFITLFLSLVGQVGDLVFSMIKRYYNKKDFSNLIPGHGGILDRFDSLIFIVLAFILLIGMI